MGKTQKLVAVQFDIGYFLDKHYQKIFIMAISMIVVSALVSLYYYRTLKSTHWKWFSIFLTILAIQEVFLTTNKSLLKENQIEFYYTYFSIPLQEIFYYWLYAVKSLKQNVLFWFFSSMLILVLASTTYLNFSNARQLTMVVSSFFLIVLVFMEFYKQISQDKILEYKTNKMFYINIGIFLFYGGCVPFYSFRTWEINNGFYYYIYFLISNCIMYLLFTVSFIWGKPKNQ